MEKKLTKKQKGITLVALIITIIVLLILAVVSIRAITGDNILGKAEAGKEKYESAKKNEEKILGDYSNSIEINGNNKNNESNTKYYKGELDGGEMVFKITNNSIIESYYGEKGGPYYKMSAYDEYEIANLNSKVKINGNIHSYNRVVAVKLNDENEYSDEDIIIENAHYSTTDFILISDSEICSDPPYWYYANEAEESMENNTQDSIITYSLATDFDTSLLSEEG